MATSTVTPAAPVVATNEATPTQEFSVQDSLNKATSAELEHWQKTGELPGEKKTTSTPAAEKTAEGKDDDKTLAASSTATTQEKTTQQRTQRTSENRWQKLSRELRETRAENERLKAATPAKTETPRETTAETRSAQPEVAAKTAAAVTNPRPKLDDVDKDGQPKFKTYAEYDEAKDTWLKDEAKRELREENSQTEQQKAQAAQKTRITEEIEQRVEQARKDYADYDEVVASGVSAKDDAGRELIFIPEGSHLQAFFFDSDRGQDVLYEILKDPDAHAAIFERNEKGDRFTMAAIRQLRELAKIEAGLKPKAAAATTDDGNGTTPAPKRTPPKLPAPPTELGARNSAPADEADAALARGDTKAYMRIVNQRELKTRK